MIVLLVSAFGTYCWFSRVCYTGVPSLTRLSFCRDRSQRTIPSCLARICSGLETTSVAEFTSCALLAICHSDTAGTRIKSSYRTRDWSEGSRRTVVPCWACSLRISCGTNDARYLINTKSIVTTITISPPVPRIAGGSI